MLCYSLRVVSEKRRDITKIHNFQIKGKKKKSPENVMFSRLLVMVPVVGVEPTRYRYHWILSPARLPIPSHRRNGVIIPLKLIKVNNFLKNILFNLDFMYFALILYNQSSKLQKL